MDLFHEIPDAEAVIRQSNGVYKQTKVYHRGGKVFVNAAGGFVRLCAHLGDKGGTSHPGINVVDISQDTPGLFLTGTPRYKTQ